MPDLPPELAAAVQRAAMPDFDRWHPVIKSVGGCEQPIHLRGERITLDGETGELIESYSTADEPTGYLITACRNRRASGCAACAEVYRDDTYHLIISGLAGGKGVPEKVSDHPCVFLTLTAPSFGAVHSHRTKSGKPQPCRPRQDQPLCQHGHPEGCGKRHQTDDPQVGQLICADCYDYPAAVLWNAHTPELWRRLTLTVPKLITAELGITHKALREQARLSYARVIGYQRRGLTHFHTVVPPGRPRRPRPPPTLVGNHQTPGAHTPHRSRPGRGTGPQPARRRSTPPPPLGPPTRHPTHPSGRRVGRHRRQARSPLHRQVRHQGGRGLRHRRPPHPLRHPHQLTQGLRPRPRHDLDVLRPRACFVSDRAVWRVGARDAVRSPVGGSSTKKTNVPETSWPP